LIAWTGTVRWCVVLYPFSIQYLYNTTATATGSDTFLAAQTQSTNQPTNQAANLLPLELSYQVPAA
jgi:hypothetical protein